MRAYQQFNDRSAYNEEVEAVETVMEVTRTAKPYYLDRHLEDEGESEHDVGHL